MKLNQISIVFILVSICTVSGCTTVPVNVVEWVPKAEPSIRFKGDVGGVAFSDGDVWFTESVPKHRFIPFSYENGVQRVNLQTGEVLASIMTDSPLAKISVGEGAVWVASSGKNQVLKIDPKTNQIAAIISVGRECGAIAVGESAVWVANPYDGTITRIEPTSNKIAAIIPVGKVPAAIAAGEESIWVTNKLDGTVSKIDPGTNQVTATIPVGKDAAGVAVGEGFVWAVRYAGVNGWRSELLKIDPSSNRVLGEPTRLGGAAWQVTVGDGAVWLNHSGYDSALVKDVVYKIDPRTDRVVEITSSNITMLEVNNGNVWVVAYTPFGGHFYLSRLLVK
jgi:YVTN family beta-propeller protein